jgi:menaquinone-dependent protoporphyrinogen oxidase
MTVSILITYATRFGSTEEVAEAIASTLREQGLKITIQPMAEVTSLAGYDAVVLGSAVNYAKWLPKATDFVCEHQDALAKMPVALFTVHIRNIADDAQSMENRLAYLDDVRPYVQPVCEGYFAGRFNRHAAVELIPRWLAFIMPTFDYRKWDKIRAWANSLPARLFRQEQSTTLSIS